MCLKKSAHNKCQLTNSNSRKICVHSSRWEMHSRTDFRACAAVLSWKGEKQGIYMMIHFFWAHGKNYSPSSALCCAIPPYGVCTITDTSTPQALFVGHIQKGCFDNFVATRRDDNYKKITVDCWLLYLNHSFLR